MELKVSGEQFYFVSMNSEQESYFPIGMCSMPLNSTLKMVNFMLCMFYQNKSNKHQSCSLLNGLWHLL